MSVLEHIKNRFLEIVRTNTRNHNEYVYQIEDAFTSNSSEETIDKLHTMIKKMMDIHPSPTLHAFNTAEIRDILYGTLHWLIMDSRNKTMKSYWQKKPLLCPDPDSERRADGFPIPELTETDRKTYAKACFNKTRKFV
jgi:hypothetical protein